LVEEAVTLDPNTFVKNISKFIGTIAILNVSATADVFVTLIAFIIVDVADGTE
jgi:hypothetical protein